MIIAISGKMGSGKDTLGQLIWEISPLFWEIKKFATLVKTFAQVLTGESMEMMNSQKGKQTFLPDWGMTVREMQQKIGTEAMRDNLHPDVWALGLLSGKYNPEHNQNWIITDLRFPNEIEVLRRFEPNQLLLLRIEGNPLGMESSNHPSETSLDNFPDFDQVIHNTGTISELRKVAEQLVFSWDLT